MTTAGEIYLLVIACVTACAISMLSWRVSQVANAIALCMGGN